MDSPHFRRRGLSGLIAVAGLAVAALSSVPAGAQQVTAGKGSVTIDLGVLNQLGQPITPGYMPYGQASTYPQAIYGRPVYGQPIYGQSAYGGYPAQPYGGLLFPPPQYPVSTLTVQQPIGSVPYVPSSTAAYVPVAPASTGGTASTNVTNSTAPATIAATPPPPPAPAATTVPMTTATTETTPAQTVTGTSTDNASTATTPEVTAPAVTTPAVTTPAVTTPAVTTPAVTTPAVTAPAVTTPAVTTPAVPVPTPPATTDTGGTTATTAATGTTSTAAIQPAAPATTGTQSGTTTTGATAVSGQTQTASIPPAAATEGQIRIVFPADSADIPDGVKAQLDSLAQKMASDDNLRIELLAYASGTTEMASRARRMSLSRALAVRSYLIKQGVRSTRMDVRALGNNVEGSPADRVDIITKAQ